MGWLKLKLDSDCLVVVVMNFGSQMMSTIFMFYYVKVFNERYHVTENWFQLSQFLFMFWNALNDPLFGFLSDVGSSNSWLRNRRKVILHGAVYFAISFLVPWFRWGTDSYSPAWLTGLHLIFALWFYDGVLSCVLLAQSALFAEFSTNHERRIRLMKYSQVVQIFGLLVLPIVDYSSSNLVNFENFQIVCIVVAVIAYFCIRYTGMHAPDAIAHVQKDTSEQQLLDGSISADLFSWKFLSDSWLVTKDVVLNRNFMSVTLGNFFHILESTTLMNFAAIFIEHLVPNILPKGSLRMSLYYGLSTVLPSLVALAASYPTARVFGPYYPLFIGRTVSIVSGLAMFAMGRQGNEAGIAVFFLVETVLCYAFYSLYNVLFSAVIDDDMVRCNRTKPISSLIFSLNALFTKPAQSIAPMVVMHFLHKHGYNDAGRSGSIDKSSSQAVSMDPKGPREALLDVMFAMVCLFPVASALLECTCLKLFQLKKHHLTSQFDTAIVQTGV